MTSNHNSPRGAEHHRGFSAYSILGRLLETADAVIRVWIKNDRRMQQRRTIQHRAGHARHRPAVSGGEYFYTLLFEEPTGITVA